MKITASNITINVKDLDKSISFYESIGFTLKMRWGGHYAQLTAEGITLGLHPSNNAKNGSGNIAIGFTTAMFEETKSDLKSLCIDAVCRSEEGGEFLHFSDPDGTALYFIKPKF